MIEIVLALGSVVIYWAAGLFMSPLLIVEIFSGGDVSFILALIILILGAIGLWGFGL